MGTGPGFYLQRAAHILMTGNGSLVRVDTRRALPGTPSAQVLASVGAGPGSGPFGAPGT